MVGLYVTSTGEAAGKSALCAGLGRKLQASGNKVGFLKAVSTGANGSDKDAEAMKQVLGLDEPADSLCPVTLGVKDLAATVDQKDPAWLKTVEQAYVKVAKGKDVVLVEGVGGLQQGNDATRVASRIAEALKAKAILLVGYQVDLEAAQISGAAKELGDALLGVVINGVPERRIETVVAQVVPSIERSGIKVLGVVPEDRELLTVTVSELAEHLGGTVLSSQERSNELVESIVAGALSPDSGLSYLRLKSNKAVITRGDHADIQMAALSTSTKCLVLTGNIAPLPTIMSRAAELEVPIVLVGNDTASTMEALEGLLDRASFHHERKLERLGVILEQSLDLDTILQAS